MPSKRSTLKGRRRPRRYAGRKARAFKKTSFAKKVLKVIHAQAESKQQMYEFGMTSFNSAATSQADINKLLPDVAQGGDNSQRIGDVITAQRLNIRGHYMLNILQGSNAVQSRIAVRMMVVSPKRYNSYDDCYNNSSKWLASVLEYGTGEQGLDGSIRSLYLPANRHTVTVHYDKVTYITQPFVPTTGITTPSTTSQDLTNSCKFFNINIKCKNKKLLFDNIAPANSANNFGPVLLFSYVHLDGGAPDTVTTNAQMTYLSTLTYEDI